MLVSLVLLMLLHGMSLYSWLNVADQRISNFSTSIASLTLQKTPTGIPQRLGSGFHCLALRQMGAPPQLLSRGLSRVIHLQDKGFELYISMEQQVSWGF